MENTIKRLLVWAVAITALLTIPFVLTLLNPSASANGGEGGGWDWTLSDFIIIGAALVGVGLAYELIGRRINVTVYRAAFGVGLFGALLLFWINGAVGIIGSEDSPANLLYGPVFLVGFIGALIARFRPRGMMYTLFTAALVQMLVPIFALFVWPAKATLGEPGIIAIFFLNAFFAALFVISGVLFRQAGDLKIS